MFKSSLPDQISQGLSKAVDDVVVKPSKGRAHFAFLVHGKN